MLIPLNKICWAFGVIIIIMLLTVGNFAVKFRPREKTLTNTNFGTGFNFYLKMYGNDLRVVVYYYLFINRFTLQANFCALIKQVSYNFHSKQMWVQIVFVIQHSPQLCPIKFECVAIRAKRLHCQWDIYENNLINK